MAALRTVLFFLGWTLGTLLLGVVGLPFLLGPQRWLWWFNGRWVAFSLTWLRLTCGIRSERRGVPEGRLIACKHQSTWDTLMLWQTFRNPTFVLKRELYRIPIFGWYLWRSGQIAIDRRDGRSAYEQIARQAPKILAQGRTIILFPEGTRVPVGQRRPYRSGIARVSAMLGLPVVPAALNAGLFWPKHDLVKRPGTAVVEFMAPMPVAPSESAAWMATLEKTIEERSAALLTPRAE